MEELKLLTEEEINFALADLPKWEREGNVLFRELVAENFIAAVGYVNAIAILAEKLNHRPDIRLYGGNKLRVETTTPNLGGLTKLDFELAKGIDALNLI